MMDSSKEETTAKSDVMPKIRTKSSWKHVFLYFALYIAGISSFLLFISDPFTMSTYFSDNSLLPGLVNREFSLETEAEYYLKYMEKLSNSPLQSQLDQLSLTSMPDIVDFIRTEIDSFGLETYTQKFSYKHNDTQYNGTNLYSIIRAERSTSSEAILLCTPFKMNSNQNTLASVALALSLTKYFSTKSYWAKDVIVLFVDRDYDGASAWLDAYHDIYYKEPSAYKSHYLYYEDLEERSGPMQAAIVFELHGKKLSRMNVKIQGKYGQLPNLDLFNLVVEMAARESITPYFHNKSRPIALSNEQLYKHHLETAISFMAMQATMKSDGLHGLFLQYAIQSLTLEGTDSRNNAQPGGVLTFSLLNFGRLIEGIFRSLNNLTERFNRSYYFYIIVSLRRFTSIAYYMTSFGLMVAPLLLKAQDIVSSRFKTNHGVGVRSCVILTFAWGLSMISLFNISTAIIMALILVPILILL